MTETGFDQHWLSDFTVQFAEFSVLAAGGNGNAEPKLSCEGGTNRFRHLSLSRLRIAERHASAHLLVSFEGPLPMSQESKSAGAAQYTTDRVQ